MKVSIHQPNFFPWYPFINKIESVDVFVILAHCQFEKNGYQNRFSNDGKWNTMSVKRGLEPIVDKIYLNPIGDWNRIKSNNSKYKNILDLFDECISESLVETNVAIIKKICKLLSIDTQIVMDYETDLKSTHRLVDICKTNNASQYLSGLSGKDYLDLQLFKNENINVVFQDISDIKFHTLELLSKEL